jgi:hypothetical protein
MVVVENMMFSFPAASMLSTASELLMPLIGCTAADTPKVVPRPSLVYPDGSMMGLHML